MKDTSVDLNTVTHAPNEEFGVSFISNFSLAEHDPKKPEIFSFTNQFLVRSWLFYSIEEFFTQTGGSP